MPTCRHCGGELKDYGGYKGKMNPAGMNVSDVWNDIYPVRHKTTKTRAYNELSVKLMERIISMGSNAGDLVVDPFGGSGTTFAVSELLGRQWLGCEIGDCNPIVHRLQSLENDKILIDKIYADRNRLFSTEAESLRRKNGFWLVSDVRSTEKVE